MSGRSRAAIGVVLVLVLAAVSTAANLFLLRLTTRDSSDPVGRLSPRAVFTAPSTPTPSTPTSPATTPQTTSPPTTTTTDERRGADD